MNLKGPNLMTTETLTTETEPTAGPKRWTAKAQIDAIALGRKLQGLNFTEILAHPDMWAFAQERRVSPKALYDKMIELEALPRGAAVTMRLKEEATTLDPDVLEEAAVADDFAVKYPLRTASQEAERAVHARMFPGDNAILVAPVTDAPTVDEAFYPAEEAPDMPEPPGEPVEPGPEDPSAATAALPDTPPEWLAVVEVFEWERSRTPFVIDGKDRLGWYARKLIALDAESDALTASYEQELARIAKRQQALRDWFDPQARIFVAEEIERIGGKAKSVDVLGGRFAFRFVPGGLRKVSKDEVLEWAEIHAPELITTKVLEDVSADALKTHWKTTGEVPAGCELVDDRQTFIFTPAKSKE